MAEFLAERKKEKAEMPEIQDKTVINEFGVAVSVSRAAYSGKSPRGVPHGSPSTTSGKVDQLSSWAQASEFERAPAIDSMLASIKMNFQMPDFSTAILGKTTPKKARDSRKVRVFSVYGRPPFAVNWVMDNQDIALQLRPDPDQAAVIMNSIVMDGIFGNFGDEEQIPLNTSAGPDKDCFVMTVSVDSRGFHVTSSDMPSHLFRHRVPWASEQMRAIEVDTSFGNHQHTTIREMPEDQAVFCGRTDQGNEAQQQSASMRMSQASEQVASKPPPSSGNRAHPPAARGASPKENLKGGGQKESEEDESLPHSLQGRSQRGTVHVGAGLQAEEHARRSLVQAEEHARRSEGALQAATQPRQQLQGPASPAAQVAASPAPVGNSSAEGCSPAELGRPPASTTAAAASKSARWAARVSQTVETASGSQQPGHASSGPTASSPSSFPSDTSSAQSSSTAATVSKSARWAARAEQTRQAAAPPEAGLRASPEAVVVQAGLVAAGANALEAAPPQPRDERQAAAAPATAPAANAGRMLGRLSFCFTHRELDDGVRCCVARRASSCTRMRIR